MKKVLSILGQFVLFLLFLGIFFVGSTVGGLHRGAPAMQWFVSHPTATSIRFFDPTGLLYVTIFFVVVFGIEAAMKRLRTAGMGTAIAYILALVIGFALKFGFATHDLF